MTLSQTHPVPELQITLKLPQALVAVRPQLLRHAQLSSDIAGAVERFAATLGVYSPATVDILEQRIESSHSGGFFTLLVNGEVCLYHDELVHRAAAYVGGPNAEAPVTSEAVERWCLDLLAGEDPRETLVVDFLGALAYGAIARHPGLLLGRRQFDSYRAGLALDDAAIARDPRADWGTLREVIDAGISIADTATVSGILAEAALTSPSARFEALVSALRPATLDICATRGYLRQLTESKAGTDAEIFALLRDGIYAELGLELPSFRFVVDDDLSPQSFAFTVGHVRRNPFVGLGVDECLVNAPRESVPYLDVRRAISNPATGQSSAVITAAGQSMAEANGLTTWNDLAFVILALAATARDSAPWLFHKELLYRDVAELRLAYPMLASLVESRLSAESLAHGTRRLLRERVSVRDASARLSGLLESDAVDGPVDELTRTPHALERLRPELRDTARERLALRRQLQDAASFGNTRTIIAYLLDAELEATAAEWYADPARSVVDLEDDRSDGVRRAIREQLMSLPIGAARPIVLTSLAAREPVREIVARRFPTLTVLAHEELTDYDVQPVARISLS